MEGLDKGMVNQIVVEVYVSCVVSLDIFEIGCSVMQDQDVVLCRIRVCVFNLFFIIRFYFYRSLYCERDKLFFFFNFVFINRDDQVRGGGMYL